MHKVNCSDTYLDQNLKVTLCYIASSRTVWILDVLSYKENEDKEKEEVEEVAAAKKQR